MISGGTLPTKNSEGGYGSAGEQPERLRSGGEGGVPPAPFSAHNVRPASPSNSLPPKAENSRPEGGTASERGVIPKGFSICVRTGYHHPPRI